MPLPTQLKFSVDDKGRIALFEALRKMDYTYDDGGNMPLCGHFVNTNLTDTVNSGQVQSFGYDWLSRLTSASTGAVGIGQYDHTYSYDAIGNITSNDGNAYTYSPTQPHAVTDAFGNLYDYDANGNQTGRTIGGVAYTFTFDYENRITEVREGPNILASFVYDADGNRVMGTVSGVTTVYIAGVYEYQGGATTSYYEGNALRRSGYATGNGILYLLQDHLKSSSVLVNQDGTLNDQNYYYPYGGNRGSVFSDLTTKRFTGQYHESGLPGGEGLNFYNARWYDAQLGRFVSADTIVPDPGNPQDLNRMAYARGNPLVYSDPSGHTLRSALDLIRKYSGAITSIAKQHNLAPVLLAGVVFAENRNDYNWIRGQDWSSIFTLRLAGGPEVKNLVSPFVRDNASTGITEVSVAVAAMMDTPELVPDNYADLSWEGRSTIHQQIAEHLPKDERQRILDRLKDPESSLDYTAKYLNFLAGFRDYGDDYALWLSDYNRGLSKWDTTTEYGRRIDVYRENINHALSEFN